MKSEDHIHILVIDDDDFLLNAIKKKLELVGYKVTISNNVHDAYFKLHVVKPDMILLDIIMPDINGIEFMALLRSQYEMLSIPIILMSYLDKRELFNMGYDLNSDRFLSKPFNMNTLPLKLQHFRLSVS